MSQMNDSKTSIFASVLDKVDNIIGYARMDLGTCLNEQIEGIKGNSYRDWLIRHRKSINSRNYASELEIARRDLYVYRDRCYRIENEFNKRGDKYGRLLKKFLSLQGEIEGLKTSLNEEKSKTLSRATEMDELRKQRDHLANQLVGTQRDFLVLQRESVLQKARDERIVLLLERQLAETRAEIENQNNYIKSFTDSLEQRMTTESYTEIEQQEQKVCMDVIVEVLASVKDISDNDDDVDGVYEQQTTGVASNKQQTLNESSPRLMNSHCHSNNSHDNNHNNSNNLNDQRQLSIHEGGSTSDSQCSLKTCGSLSPGFYF